MEHPQLNWIANFIWGIADDVLRDLYVRGKYRDLNRFMEAVAADASECGVKLTAKRKNWLASRDEAAAPVIKKKYKPGVVEPAPIRGLVKATVDGQRRDVEYEPDSELRAVKQVPLLNEGGIEGFLRREVYCKSQHL